MADDDDLLKLVARQAYRDATGQTLREEVVRLRAQLEKVRADRDAMIAVHDEVERERDEARHAILSRPSSELLRQVQDERERLRALLATVLTETERLAGLECDSDGEERVEQWRREAGIVASGGSHG